MKPRLIDAKCDIQNILSIGGSWQLLKKGSAPFAFALVAIVSSNHRQCSIPLTSPAFNPCIDVTEGVP
jgi:hypothetical protein